MSLTEVEPDPHTAILQLVEDVRQMRGIFWEKLKLPEEIIRAMARGESPMSPVISVDRETFLVLPAGKIVYAFDQNRVLKPEVLD